MGSLIYFLIQQESFELVCLPYLVLIRKFDILFHGSWRAEYTGLLSSNQTPETISFTVSPYYSKLSPYKDLQTQSPNVPHPERPKVNYGICLKPYRDSNYGLGNSGLLEDLGRLLRYNALYSILHTILGSLITQRVQVPNIQGLWPQKPLLSSP